MAAINPKWRYWKNPPSKIYDFIELFETYMGENKNSKVILIYSHEEMIIRYLKALKFWIDLDPLKMQHIDFSLDIYDCGRIENSLIHKLSDANQKDLSKICAHMYIYIYKRMFRLHPDIGRVVCERLRMNAKL